MTTDTTPTGSSAAAVMLRAGLGVSAVLTLVAAVVAGIVTGADGVAGAVAGASIVAVFFAASLSVLGATRRADPAVALLVALALYTAKIVALAVLFVVLDATGVLGGALDRTSFALTIIASTLAWVVVQIVAAVRHRQPLYDLVPTGGERV